MEIEEEIEYEIKKKVKTIITPLNLVTNNLFGLTPEVIE